jgi:AraC-like DNA-binding protein
VSGIHVALQEQALEPRSLYFGFKPFCSTSFKPAGSSWPELIEQTVPLQDLLGSANQILERLSIARSFSERIWAIRSFTRERIIDSDYVPDLVEFAEQKLCAAHGAVSIETMGDYTCYSNRYCRERFKDACGISQKSYANIMRFQNAVRMLASVDPKQKPRLADVIVENGYFDQSHLNREFRRFVNSTPRRFFQTLGLR